MTIEQMLTELIRKKPADSDDLDLRNILVAVNGADSSAMGGPAAVLRNGDEVSIIPVIHGGSGRMRFRIGVRRIEMFSLILSATDLDILRLRHSRILLQAVSSRYILGISHAKKLIGLSLAAQKNNTLLSKRLETDILMRFACTTQISSAINTVGIKPKQQSVLVAIGPQKYLNRLYVELCPNIVRDLDTRSNYVFLKRHFGITPRHLAATRSKTPLEDILVEKAAILF